MVKSIHSWWRITSIVLALAGCGSEPSTGEARSFAGELEALVAQGGAGEDTLFQLHAEDGRVLLLDVDDVDASELETGDRLVVHGSLDSPNGFTVRRIEHVARVTQALTGQPVSRTSRLAVLLVHWTQPNAMTPTAAREGLVTDALSVRNLYRESSYGQHDMTADVFGWFSISAPTTCDFNGIRARAEAAATAAGVNLPAFTNVVVYFPTFATCQFSGLATMGTLTRPGRHVWLNGPTGTTFRRVAGHELGHNFALSHAQSYRCGASAIAAPASCVVQEFGDPFDPMGSTAQRHFNAHEKKVESWFGGCNMLTTPRGGSFNVRPLEPASNNVQALRVPIAPALCPTSIAAPCEYVVEYRQPLGFDGQGGGISGVQVRVASRDLLRNTVLLDMNPATTTFADAALGVGQTFKDPNGVVIAVSSATSTRAVVNVTVPQGTGSTTCLDGSTF